MPYQDVIREMFNDAKRCHMKNRHIAAILYNNKPIAKFGRNNNKEMVFNEYRGSTHAEMSAIENLLSKKYILWVRRGKMSIKRKKIKVSCLL